MLLPPALGFSPHPPVSVFGTGARVAIAAFLGTGLLLFPTLFRSASRLWLMGRFFQSHTSSACTGLLLPGLQFTPCVPTFLNTRSTGISTCCPSATPFGLALGPDLPRADQLYPGILGYSARRILTFFSLLIPAFSLLKTPLLLSVQLLRFNNAPLPPFWGFPLWILSFGDVFEPRLFSAQGLSASELLRTLLMYGCF